LKVVSFGDRFLVSSAADRTVAIWDVRSDNPLLFRFNNLAESVRGLMVHENQLVCGVGNKLLIASLDQLSALVNRSAASPPVTKFQYSMSTIKGYSSRSFFSAMCVIPSYCQSVLATEVGGLILT